MRARTASDKKPGAESTYVLLGGAWLAAGRYPEIIDVAGYAIAHWGTTMPWLVLVMATRARVGAEDLNLGCYNRHSN